jgi:hypothetical protein
MIHDCDSLSLFNLFTGIQKTMYHASNTRGKKETARGMLREILINLKLFALPTAMGAMVSTPRPYLRKALW